MLGPRLVPIVAALVLLLLAAGADVALAKAVPSGPAHRSPFLGAEGGGVLIPMILSNDS